MRKKEYDLFRLQVRSDNKLEATFVGVEDDERSAPRPVRAELDLNEDARYAIEVLNVLLNSGNISEKYLQQLGSRLYEALFPNKIGTYFEEKWQEAKNNERGLRLSITVEEGSEVLNWPLEFLKGPPHISWLASRRDLTLSRRVTFEQDISPAEPAKGSLRVLIVVSKPKGLGGVMSAKVIEEISDWAAGEDEKGWGGEPPIQITVLGILDDYEQEIPGANYLAEYATFKNFRKYANDLKPHILHFIGHGEIQEGYGHLALVNDDNTPHWLSSNTLAEMVIDINPRMVVLQACQTAQKDTARETHSGFLSMAEYLVRNWIPAVVAMQFEIQNDYAIEFATGFYEALARGLEVDAAVQEGRSNIVDLYQWKERYFGAPVLYMDSPYVIMESPEEAATPSRSREPTRSTVAPQSFPSIEMLILQNLEFAKNTVGRRDWALTTQILRSAQSYVSGSNLDPMTSQILNNQFERVAMAEQAESDGDEARVDDLIKLILAELDICMNILQFGGTTRGASGLQPQPGPAVPDRGGPSTGRAGGSRDPYPHDRPKSIS